VEEDLVLIKFKKTIYEDTYKDVDFPIYRKYPKKEQYKNSEWFYKVNDKLEEISINFYDPENVSIETDKDIEFSGDEEYEFGRGKYACTAEEFNKAYSKALDIITGV
jgi:hypothetical protein